MSAKMIWANYSVKDASRTQKFYSDLGFVSSKQNNLPQLASFVFGDDKFVIHFFQKGSQIDEFLPGETSTSEIIFTLSAESEAEVKDWSDKIKAAGGKILKDAGRDESGYYGLAFSDPDGHKFNILLMENGM